MRDINQRYGYLGARLRSKRAERGMTLERLSQVTDIDISYLNQIETGETAMPYNTFVAIAMALESTSDELLSQPEAALDRLVMISDFRRAK